MTDLTHGLAEAFGHRYTVEDELGRGATGVVYRARDRILDRPVALKVLHVDPTQQETAQSRFEHEAKILASIRSPGIAAIYGYEESGDTHMLVLELIDGRTLRERLAEGPMPLSEVAAVCGAVATALESAHDLGIIHCDLKPENVKITPEGVVKILDFGIAVAMGASSARLSRARVSSARLEAVLGTHASHSRPVTHGETGIDERTTSVDAMFGTPPYMSPEQVLLDPLSSRTDTWAFGCLLFECLAGRSPFARSTAPETLMAVVSSPPDWTLLPRTTPRRLRDLLQRCLEKDPVRRLWDLSEARDQLMVSVFETSPDHRAAKKLRTHNLPAAHTRLVGRAQEVRQIAGVLAHTHLVTVMGPAGSGKTRLANEVGLHLVETFADGVRLAELTADIEPPALPGVVAAALGFSAKSADDLMLALRNKEMLLILDAGEQALEECADLVSRLLSDCPSLSVLAVGSAALEIAGEAAYTVRPLAWPTSESSATLADLHDIESVDLFVDRARSAVPSFTLTEQTAPSVMDICRLLAGVPLALELAAAQLQTLSVDRLARSLSEAVDRPTSRRPMVQASNVTVRTVIEWAIRRLSPHEVTLLRRLAVFAGGWTMEAARAVCEGDGVDDVFSSLARLAELSFVFVESRAGHARYRMANPIRTYAFELLGDSSDCMVTRRRHCEFYLALAERIGPMPERDLGHDQVGADDANLRTAVAFSRDVDEGEDLWAMFGTVQEESLFIRLAVFRGAFGVAAAEAVCGDGIDGIPDSLARMTEQSLLIAQTRDGALRYEMPVRVRNLARERLLASGEATTIGRRYRAFFLALAEEGHDGLSGPEQVAWHRRMETDEANLWDAASSYQETDEADAGLRFITAMSRYWEMGGDVTEARQLTERTLSKFGAKADPAIAGNALVAAARVTLRAGDFAATENQLERAYRLYQRVQQRSDIARVLDAQARLALRRGSYAEARALCEKSLSLYRELGDEHGTAWSLLTLGEVRYRDGDYSASRDIREEALALFRGLHDERGLAWALTNVGKIAFRQGDLAAAHAHHTESLALHRALGDQAGVAWSLSSLAHVVFARGDLGGARMLLEESLVLSKQSGNAHGVAWSLVHLANVAYYKDEARTAGSLFMEGLALFRQMRAKAGRAWCLQGMGNVARRRGKFRSARTLLAESLVAFAALGEKRGVASALRRWSLLAAATGEPHKAAQLFGAAEALQIEMGERLIPPEQREMDAHTSALRLRLGDLEFSSAWEHGRAPSLEDAVSLALGRQEDTEAAGITAPSHGVEGSRGVMP